MSAKPDSIKSILYALLANLSIAVAIVTSALTGNSVYDAVGTVIIGVLLVVIAINRVERNN